MSADLAEVQPVSDMHWLEKAIDRGADAETIGKLIELKNRMEDRLARQEFANAMKACQEEMPVLLKDKKGQNSSYVELDTIKLVCAHVWRRHGFSLSWGQADSPSPELTRVVVTLHHTGGHFERYQGDYPIDGRGAKGGGVMSPLQGTVSAHTYAQRDMIRLIFDLTIAGQDKDGMTGISADDIRKINLAIEGCQEEGYPVDFEAFLKRWNIESLEQLPKASLEQCLRELQRKKAGGGKKSGKAGA